MIPEILKKRWHKAIWSAMGSCGPLAASAARRPVPVVPMLEPRVSGYMRSILIMPIPTSGVRAEVKTELLCTSTVMRAPASMATYPVRHENGAGKSAFSVFLITLAMEPCSMELSSLTISTRHVHRSAREKTRSRVPATVSSRSTRLSNDWPETQEFIVLITITTIIII